MANGRAVARFRSDGTFCCTLLIRNYGYEQFEIINFYLHENNYLTVIVKYKHDCQWIPRSRTVHAVRESRSQTCVKTCIIVQRVLEARCNTIVNETMLMLKLLRLN